jgi:hypothetical protein
MNGAEVGILVERWFFCTGAGRALTIPAWPRIDFATGRASVRRARASR